MPIARKRISAIGVGVRFSITIVIVITLSWILSAASTIYFARQEGIAIKRELQAHSRQLPPDLRRALRNPMLSSIWRISRDGYTVFVMPVPYGKGVFFAGMGIVLLLAVTAGAILSHRITRPLSALARGAQALHDGQLDHRIPVIGNDEFARVATSLNEMAKRLSVQIATLEQDAARRQQLLADVAHELRSPVATVKTMAEALRDGVADMPERRALALDAMVENAGRLQRLVHDLLELARLDLHELPLHRETVDLRPLAAAGLRERAEAAAQAGIALRPLEDGPPLRVTGDPHRLAQALNNLLDNAITYAGPDAEVRITLHPGTGHLLIVEDTGRGIPARHLPYLFDAFYRADASRTPTDAHSGLGLRIARGLVEAHGGTLTLDSREGEGTRVTVTLPAA